MLSNIAIYYSVLNPLSSILLSKEKRCIRCMGNFVP